VTYKFLIGARRAGVALALVLMGVSWALGGVLTVNLGELKTDGTPIFGRPGVTYTSADSVRYRAVVTSKSSLAGDGDSIIGFWRGGAGDSIIAISKMSGKGNPAIRFVVSDGTTALISGTTTLKPDSISFTAAGSDRKAKVIWDGGTITGNTTAAAKVKDAFFYTDGVGDSVILLSGNITASSKSVVVNVGNRLRPASTKGPGVRIGDGDSTQGTNGKILTITHLGRRSDSRRD